MVQTTLLFRAYKWVMPPSIWRNLSGFHHRVAHWLAKIQLSRYITGRGFYLPLD